MRIYINKHLQKLDSKIDQNLERVQTLNKKTAFKKKHTNYTTEQD